MKKNRTQFITKAAIIAALYVVLTGVSAMFNLDKGIIQLRLSEALTILPLFTPAAIPGLFFGCLLSNSLFGALPLDVLLGSIATLIGAIGTYYIGHVSKFVKRGAKVINSSAYTEALDYCAFKNPDGEIVLAVLNTQSNNIPIIVRLDGHVHKTEMPAHSIATFVINKEK